MDVNSRVPSQNIIPFRIKGVDVARFDSAGNLGIGTNTPTTKLDVTGNARVTAASAASTALTTTGRIGVNQATPTTALDITGDARVTAASATSTALTTTGRVGINIAAPTTTLDVSGAARISGELNMVSNKIVNLANPTSDQDAATQFYVKAAAAAATAVGSAAQTTANTAVTNAAAAQTTANTAVTNASAAQTTANAVNAAIFAGSATAAARYLYPSSGNSVQILTNDTLRLHVSAGGRVAIGGGVTDPQQLLDVRGSIYCAGRLGIGHSTPEVPLYVRDFVDQAIDEGSNAYYAFNTAGRVIGSTTSTRISIISDQGIWIRGGDAGTGGRLWLTSDQRIKTNIVNLNTDKMMNIFRHLRPISFDYITNMKNNNKKHFGFIAQEVNEILPEGISLNKDVIPNNMMKGDIAKPSETDEPPCFTLKPDDTDITLQYLLLTTDSPLKIDTANPYSSTNVYKFKIYGGDKWAKEHDIYIRSDYNVTDDKYTYVFGLKKEAYDVVIREPTLFVYGQYVNDLHILHHDTIYTVATAALQEVDRQQQADKARIAELEATVDRHQQADNARIAELEATVAAQHSLINDILERLKNAKL